MYEDMFPLRNRLVAQEFCPRLAQIEEFVCETMAAGCGLRVLGMDVKG